VDKNKKIFEILFPAKVNPIGCALSQQKISEGILIFIEISV
jgi:hypothetical protein